MLARLKQMLIKEFIQVFRDKRTRFVLFGPPIIQMLIFGYAATFEIQQRAHGRPRSRPQPGEPRTGLPFLFQSVLRRAASTHGPAPDWRPD